MAIENYTPEQIEEILQAFFEVAGTRQYIGARYVPIFGRGRGTPIEWDNSDAYEPLSIVYYQGDTYTSRRYVPAGIQIDNQDYWVITGRYNAQVEQYRQEVLGFDDRITSVEDIIPTTDFDATNTVKKYVDDTADDLRDELVPFPNPQSLPKYGNLGQVLSTLANGGTQWVDPIIPSDEQAEEIITAWLNDHPEATTTVQDNSVTDAKLVQSGGILSTVGKCVYRQNSAARVANVALNVSNGDILYFKPLVWGGVSFTSINVNGVNPDSTYTNIGGVTAIGQEKFITATSNFTNFVINVAVPSVPSSPVEFDFILVNISKLDNIAAYVMKNKYEIDETITDELTSQDSRLDSLESSVFKNYGYLGATANINQLTTQGWYTIASSRIATMTGLPDQLKVDAYLYVYNGPFIVQYIRELSYPYDSYQRYIFNNIPSTWVRQPCSMRPRKIYLFGDSLTVGALGNSATVGTSYLELWARKCGYNSIVNCGIGGIGYVYSTYKSEEEVPWNTGGGRLRAQDVVNHYASELSTADTVILAYGVNDWQTLGDTSVTITEPDRRATSTNIEANVKTIIQTVITSAPNTRLIVVTPINTSFRGGSIASGWALETSLDNNNDGLEAMTLEKVYDAIVTACDYYGVKYIDMTHGNSVLNYINIDNILPDHLHPTQGAYYRFAEDMETRDH